MEHCLDPEDDHRTDGDVKAQREAQPATMRSISGDKSCVPYRVGDLRACRVIRPGT